MIRANAGQAKRVSPSCRRATPTRPGLRQVSPSKLCASEAQITATAPLTQTLSDSPLPQAHQLPETHTTALALLEARQRTRDLSPGPALAALSAALESAPQLARCSFWQGHNGHLLTYGGSEQRPGLGASWAGSFEDFAAWMQSYALQVHPKGQGRTLSYAKSLHAGSSDAEAVELYAAFADCDGQAPWQPVHRKLVQLNVAHHLFARNDTHWHLVLWFSSPLKNPHTGDRTQTAAWKSTFFRPFYGALLGFFSELLGIECKLATPEGDPSVSLLGFDAKTDRLLNLQYAPCRRSEDDEPPSVVFHQGLALNPRLLLEKLELLPDEHAPLSAPRRKRSKPHREPVERQAVAPRPPPEAPANDEADHEMINALGHLSSEGWRKGGLDRCARALGGALGASGFEAERAATIVACAAWRAGCGAHVESMKKKARKAAQRALDDLPVPQLGRLRSWFPDLHRALLPHLPLLRSFLQKEQEAFGRLLPPDEASSLSLIHI